MGASGDAGGLVPVEGLRRAGHLARCGDGVGGVGGELGAGAVAGRGRWGAWSARDLLRLRLEQRLVLLAFGLALLLASWVAAMRAGGWSLGTTVGLAAVTVLLAAWRGVVVRRAASCLADEATAQLALRDYGDGLTVTVFLGTLLAVATFGGGDLLQGVLLLAATGIAAMVTFGAMLTYYDVVDPVQVHGG